MRGAPLGNLLLTAYCWIAVRVWFGFRGRRFLILRRFCWPDRFGGDFGQDFVDETRGHDGSEDGTISGLFDLETVKEGFYIDIGTLAANGAFGGMKEADKGSSFFGDGLGVGITVGKGLGAEVEGTKIAGGNDGDGGFGKEQAPTAESAEGAHFVGLDTKDGKGDACQRNLPVELAEQPGSAKRRGEFAGAVDDAANDFGIRMIGNRDAVVGKNGDAHGSSLEREVVDIEAAVIVDRRGELLEVSGQAAGVDLADEDFGEARFRGGTSSAAPTLRIVDGEGGLVEIAFELKASLVDEFLVFGLAGNRRQLAGGIESSNPLEINIEETIRAREKASGLRRGVLAQSHDQSNGGDNQNNGQEDGEAASNAHRFRRVLGLGLRTEASGQ